MPASIEHCLDDRRSQLGLWAGILAGPLAWLTILEANFALVPWACAYRWEWLLHAVNLGGLAIAAAAGALSWRNWKLAGRHTEDEGVDIRGRARFMAILGLLISALFFLVMLGQEIANLMLGPCD